MDQVLLSGDKRKDLLKVMHHIILAVLETEQNSSPENGVISH